MKIIINAYQYGPTVTGTDRMAANFLRELQKIDSENQYFVVCSSENYIQPIISSSNFKILQPKHFSTNSFIKRLINKLWRTFLSLTLLPIKADVYFSFHNMRLPKIRVAKKMIASNLDLIPLQLDEYKSLVPGQDTEIERVAKTADGFVSISEFSKKELCTLLNVEPKKVTVIYLAADAIFSADAMLEASSGLPDKYVLTMGGSEPRKNVKTTVEAHSKLPPKLRSDFPLLIIGESWHGRPLEPLKIDENVKLLGNVADKELAGLYKKAAVFVFASKYEGFGFTILEAMASGAPVISANSSSLPEVYGDAALSFEPDAVEALTKELEQVLTDEQLRSRLAAAGKQQSQKFSWVESAQKLHKLLTGAQG